MIGSMNVRSCLPAKPMHVVVAITALLLLSRTPAVGQVCTADCSGDNVVTVNELITCVGVVLGNAELSVCPACDGNGDGDVNIADLVGGVGNLLTACPEPVETATPQATETPDPTATPETTETAAPTQTETVAPTATQVPVATPTVELLPIGEALGGRAAVVSTGLGSIQSFVAAVVTGVTGGGAGASNAELGLDLAVGGGVGVSVDNCTLGGTTSQECSGDPPAIELILSAMNCIVAGPASGSAEFNGTINLNSTGFIGSCDPPRFTAAAFVVDNLQAVFRNSAMQTDLTVTANLTGTFTLTPNLTDDCLVSALNITLSGTLEAQLPDGTGTSVQFGFTIVNMSDITFNEDCVPLVYTLSLFGPATFTELASGDSFDVVFDNFMLMQDATGDPVLVDMMGSISSDCFGGEVILQTLAPVAVAAGQLCPTGGQVEVAMGENTEVVSYTPSGEVLIGDQTFSSCLDEGLRPDCPDGS